jgi:8-oxo-dGTP pyrophosphatase MutT (NUDIX family)
VDWETIRAAPAARAPVDVAEEVASRAAVAIVLREGTDGLEALFIRRAEHPRDPWSGQFAFPGGRAEPHDADLAATAVRETQEEIGLDLTTTAELLGRLDEVRAMARLRPMNLTITPFVFRLRVPATLTISPEVTSLHWLSLPALVDPGARSTTRYVHEQTSLEFPSLEVDGVVIWGLTYRMFTGLVERMRAAQDAAAGSATA